MSNCKNKFPTTIAHGKGKNIGSTVAHMKLEWFHSRQENLSRINQNKSQTTQIYQYLCASLFREEKKKNLKNLSLSQSQSVVHSVCSAEWRENSMTFQFDSIHWRPITTGQRKGREKKQEKRKFCGIFFSFLRSNWFSFVILNVFDVD